LCRHFVKYFSQFASKEILAVVLFVFCLGFSVPNGRAVADGAAAHQSAFKSESDAAKRMNDLRPEATFRVGGNPDWMAVADDAVWVAIASLNRVTQLSAERNEVGISIPIQEPCSGLVAGFGSMWIPSCGTHSLIRADLKTGSVQATIPIGPADSEGCIAVGADSVWLATNRTGILSRIDPKTNAVVASITIPSGSFCPVFADGLVWVTSTEHSVLAKIDPSTNKTVAEIPVGKNPRFATSGGGAVWTLNQGDGTISRVDTNTGKLIASIAAGLSGHGGEIAFGFGAVWVTMIRTPITRIDARDNTVVHQWTGDGGDSIRAGLGSIWLTNLKGGVVWRISPAKL
jgi:virginiamycin B lyase